MSPGRGHGKPANVAPPRCGEPTAAAAGPIGARVIADSFKGWRVVCPLHGELASYRKFWPASRDVGQHREACELTAAAGCL